jgi:hypothetical protein
MYIQYWMASLKVLAELLGAEADRIPRTAAPSALCRESLMAISVLVPKLEATVRALLYHESEEMLRQGARLCEQCDD